MASRKMTKEEQTKISKLIYNNRQTYYDENVERMREPMEAALAAYHAQDGETHTHPDKKAAFKHLRAEQKIFFDWQSDNCPDTLAAEAKTRRKKFLGNKKKNRQKIRSKTEILDLRAIEEQAEEFRRGPVYDFSSWLFDGALVSTKEKDVGLVIGVYKHDDDFVNVMVNGQVDILSKKSLRPVDD